MKKNKKGFTLLELVIVIAVVAILAAVLIPTFSAIIKRSKLSTDVMVCKNLNTTVSTIQISDAKIPQTMTEVISVMVENGYKVDNLKASNPDNVFVYDSINNRFFVYDYVANKVSFKDDNIKINLSDAKTKVSCWIVSDTYTQTNINLTGFSIYLKDNYEGPSTLNITTGLDVGNNSGIETINYDRHDAESGQDVVIRTNSASTTLTINAEHDTIHHYDTLGALNIVKANTASYHENGNVGYAEIAYGRIVLEKGADVEEIHINKKENEQAFDTVIIANNGGAEELPERITRDAVTVSQETLVVKVESNGSSENVFVYADGATGTKGSTQKITEGENKQNENVNSALGQLVLDNGTTADKAQTAEEKADAKDAAASEAVSAGFANQEGNGNYVARIGQTGYYSLPDAIQVANASENSVTISLLKDVQQSGSLLIRNSISINGGNHKITTVGTATSGNMAAFDICDTEQKSPIIVNVKDLTINSTKHSRVFLLNADYCSYDNTNILNVNNLIITTDGQALYSNGPATINARNCEIKHEGQYLSGKDPVYYSAIIVGYNGTLNIYDSKVSSFGNGASTFPSGGTVNIYNTEITAFDDFVDASTGYLFWARHEKSYDTGSYKDWCGSAIINVYSGVFEGPYRITHDGLTSANRIAAINIYGGTFEQNPSEYVQAGHSSQQNQDGTWTVK